MIKVIMILLACIIMLYITLFHDFGYYCHYQIINNTMYHGGMGRVRPTKLFDLLGYSNKILWVEQNGNIARLDFSYWDRPCNWYLKEFCRSGDCDRCDITKEYQYVP